jgi:hypothetical protein
MVGSLIGNLRGFWVKKNLTEINHKVSVIARGLGCEIAAVFAAKCAGARETPLKDPAIPQGD